MTSISPQFYSQPAVAFVRLLPLRRFYCSHYAVAFVLTSDFEGTPAVLTEVPGEPTPVMDVSNGGSAEGLLLPGVEGCAPIGACQGFEKEPAGALVLIFEGKVTTDKVEQAFMSQYGTINNFDQQPAGCWSNNRYQPPC